MVPLLAEDVPDAIDIRAAELPIAGGRPRWMNEAFTLQEPNLGYGHIGELLNQGVDDRTDLERFGRGHAPRATTRWNRPMITSSPD